jgi:hypothetical protein
MTTTMMWSQLSTGRITHTLVFCNKHACFVQLELVGLEWMFPALSVSSRHVMALFLPAGRGFTALKEMQ